jgi:hypothetical protein
VLSPAAATLHWDAAPLDPGEFKDYVLDWSAELDANGATIASSAWALSSEAIADGIEMAAPFIDEKTVGIWLKGGTGADASVIFNPPGKQYVIQNTLTDSAGRILQRSIRFTAVQL